MMSDNTPLCYSLNYLVPATHSQLLNDTIRFVLQSQHRFGLPRLEPLQHFGLSPYDLFTHHFRFLRPLHNQ